MHSVNTMVVNPLTPFYYYSMMVMDQFKSWVHSINLKQGFTPLSSTILLPMLHSRKEIRMSVVCDAPTFTFNWQLAYEDSIKIGAFSPWLMESCKFSFKRCTEKSCFEIHTLHEKKKCEKSWQSCAIQVQKDKVRDIKEGGAHNAEWN